MTSQPVEWVLVIYYGVSAHKATYGRLAGGGYTKDYIQLSRTEDFLDPIAKVLSVPAAETGTVPISFRWPNGSAQGDFVFRSADRPHLKWETSEGAPSPWKMAASPSDSTSQTIPGNPACLVAADADLEFTSIASRGGGQPYLMAIKLKDEPRTFHLRAYLDQPSSELAWADLKLAPVEIQNIAAQTSQSSTLAWSLFASAGIGLSTPVDEIVSRLAAAADHMEVLESLDPSSGRALANYLQDPGTGLFFDPQLNHKAWTVSKPLPMTVAESVEDLLRALESLFPALSLGDSAAEMLDTSAIEVEEFQRQIEYGKYAVADATATTKTRGNAQRAFANEVKANYGYRCAVTGITSKDFLIASHIVPWSVDHAIRLDPSNGICLSLLVDRAFEKGYITIDDSLKIYVDETRVGDDEELLRQLQPLHGKSLTAPEHHLPRLEYLQRRRTLVAPQE